MLFLFLALVVPVAAVTASATTTRTTASFQQFQHQQRNEVFGGVQRLIQGEQQHRSRTVGGGMDQAISLFAQTGTAQYIEFHPNLRHRVIPLPTRTSYCWVVCNSLEEAHKRVNADQYFNRRVIECRIGCRLLAMELEKCTDKQHNNQVRYPSCLWELVESSRRPLIELEQIAPDRLASHYTKQEVICKVLCTETVYGDTTSTSSTAHMLAAELGIAGFGGC
jgi:hypothetical protein